MVSELVSNAVRYGGGPTLVKVGVGEDILLEVTDHEADALPELSPTRHPLSERGRGLRIVDRLCTSWGTARGRDGKSVWARVPFGGIA